MKAEYLKPLFFKAPLVAENLLNARGAKDLRKVRKYLIVSHLFFATFAKIPCFFALKILLRQPLNKVPSLRDCYENQDGCLLHKTEANHLICYSATQRTL